MSVKLGYACINMTLKKDGIYVNRTITIKRLNDNIDKIKELATNNLQDLYKILVFNEANGIRFYRMSSDMFPHFGNPKVKSYSIDFARDLLLAAGNYAKHHGHRITMHPGQYTQLGSTNDAVVNQAIIDIENHAHILNMMGLSPSLGSCIIIHGGGTFKDKQSTIRRISQNFGRLSKSAREYLVFENDDHHYTVLDLLPLCETLGVPLCIDFFHHECNGAAEFDVYEPPILDRAIATWHGRKPKCHYSSQKPNARLGAHSDCMETLPSMMLDTCKKYDIDIMIEAKDKELCVLRLYDKYYEKKIYNDNRVEWIIK